MRGRTGIGAFLGSIALLIAAAPPARAEGAAARGTVEISFGATSSLHDFEGAAAPIAFSLSQGADGAWSAEVGVPVTSLDTGIARRDAKLREWLDSEGHPEIRGRFRGVDPERVRRTGVLPFALEIRGAERPLEARVSGWQQDERRARFDAEFEVSLRAFGLEAPRVLFIRVGDLVRVRVRVTLERA